jgi:putative spermidine/putrescine transport system substrate-binding protein
MARGSGVPRVAAMAFHLPGPAPSAALWGRRCVLQLGLASAGGLLLPGLLGGCRRGDAPLLLAPEGELPLPWLKRLPAPWQRRAVAGPAEVLASLVASGDPAIGPDLLALPDGWASGLSPAQLQPLALPQLLEQLSEAAQPLSRLYRGEGSAALAFPWAFSPWVLALRSQPELAKRAAEGWDLLLDPSLRQKLVLPSSPRVCMALVGGDFERLRALRANALAYDDANALNLLLSGAAVAAVVPLRRLIPLLRRDQRLQVLLPASGAPLSWQLLLRVAGGEPPPLDWLQAVLEPPLLPRLLAAGWVPPLPRRRLAAALADFPPALAQLLLPAEPLLRRCWSLPPLDLRQSLALQTLWDAAAPSL